MVIKNSEIETADISIRTTRVLVERIDRCVAAETEKIGAHVRRGEWCQRALLAEVERAERRLGIGE